MYSEPSVSILSSAAEQVDVALGGFHLAHDQAPVRNDESTEDGRQTPRPPRSNSGTPTAASMLMIFRESAGCLVPLFLAA